MGRTKVSELVTADMRRRYAEEGYFILPSVLTAEQLGLLRGEAEYAVNKIDAEMDVAGTDRIGINKRGKRYFPAKIYRDRPVLREFLFSELMAEICRATLGENAYLFHEQYVIKLGDPESSFPWHQDSGYVHEDHEPYLTCWIALDDVTEQNGSVYLLPYSRSGIRSYIKHIWDPAVQDKACYFGTDSGVPVVVPAGSIVVFSSVVIHRSGPNHTSRARRVYLAQYSKEIITSKDGSRDWSAAEAFLADGRIMAQP